MLLLFQDQEIPALLAPPSSFELLHAAGEAVPGVLEYQDLHREKHPCFRAILRQLHTPALLCYGRFPDRYPRDGLIHQKERYIR